jgi:hypothetical protein
MINVLLKSFKLTSVAKERRIKSGIALDAAPLTKTISGFTVLFVICDPNAINPNMGLKISKFISNLNFVTARILGTNASDSFLFPFSSEISIAQSHLSCLYNNWERDQRKS